MDELKFDKHNANAGTERGQDLLEQSLQELGAGRSGLIDKDGNVIAGNKTLKMAQRLGLKVRVVQGGKDELIMVQREDLDLNDPTGEARRLAYLDNRVSELDLAWNAGQVAEDVEAGLSLEGLGFTDKELMKMMLELEHGENELVDPGADINRAQELWEKWQVKRRGKFGKWGATG